MESGCSPCTTCQTTGSSPCVAVAVCPLCIPPLTMPTSCAGVHQASGAATLQNHRIAASLKLTRNLLACGAQLLPALDHVELAWHRAAQAGNKNGALVLTGERDKGKFFRCVLSAWSARGAGLGSPRHRDPAATACSSRCLPTTRPSSGCVSHGCLPAGSQKATRKGSV